MADPAHNTPSDPVPNAPARRASPADQMAALTGVALDVSPPEPEEAGENTPNREIALELASTNYLLTQILRIGIMHASTAAAHMAEDVEHNFRPTAPLSTPNIN